MKKILFILSVLFIAACSQVDSDIQRINCKRTHLINTGMKLVLKADNENDTEMKNIAICFTATMYEIDKDSLKRAANSESVEKKLMWDILVSCQNKVKNLTNKEFVAMSQNALKASNFSKQHESCFNDKGESK